MPASNDNQRPVPGEPDDMERLLQEQLEDPDFRVTYEDAEARSALIQFLVQLRRERGWTQTELAHRLKTTQSAVSDLEKSVIEPRLPTLQRWARAYGYRLEFQLWEGPLMHYNSWVGRQLPYADVIQAIRADDAIAQSWFASTTSLIDRPDVGPKGNRVPVHIRNLAVDVHYKDPAEAGDEFLRELTTHLASKSGE